MSAPRPDAAERHLIALWGSVRDALVAVEEGSVEPMLLDPQLSALLGSLAADSARLSIALKSRLGAAVQSTSDDEPHPTPPRPRVLVVDDEPVTLNAMRELLSDDYDVAASTNATEAARVAREHCPDAIVTDLNMPGVDGLGLIELLKADRVTPQPPLLVVSASGEPHSRNRALERGAFDYLTKPVDVPELLARLRRAVRYGQDLKREHALQLVDDLTGLYNRRALNLSLQRCLSHGAARQEPVSLALVDQDGLKSVNDRFGHAAGDRCLIAVARALTAVSRLSDVVVRQGGDEFAVVMPGTSCEGATAMLERAIAELKMSPVEVEPGVRLTVEISYGVSLASGPVPDPATVIASADQALYAMKRGKAARAADAEEGHRLDRESARWPA